MKVGLIVASVLAGLAMPVVVNAQGVVGGTEQGASQGVKEGNKAAGPVGGAVGGVVGGTAGGAKGVLGIPSKPKHKSKTQTQN